jgi:pyruvate ferredoxin oxidoreductase gamma subunit
MEQIRFHGRGGQGVVTAAELIALAGFFSGLEAQAFPNFGVERTGAPIQSYVRLSDQPIITREQIYRPTVLIIQDATLIDTADVFTGSDKNTKIIINAPANRWPELTKRYKYLYFSPATKIALEIIGKNITNTVILGAFARYTKLITLEALKKAIREKFADKGPAIIEKNIAAITKAYEQTI